MITRLTTIFRTLLIAVGLGTLGTTFSQAQPANDMFTNRIVISGTNTVVIGSNVGATRETGEPYHAGNSGGASIWWSWQAPKDGVAIISTSGSTFDTVLGVYAGSSVSTLATVASNDDDPDSGDFTSKVSFSARANQIYQIAVDGYWGDSGYVMLSVQLVPPTPPPPAPAWQLPDPDGNWISSTDLAGKVIIVDFWATWCNPCKAEMPDLVALQSKYGTDGLVIVGADVSWSGENAQTVKDFLATFTPKVNYQVVMSNANNDNAFGGIDAIPTTFIIDRQNVIQKQYVGTQAYDTLENQILPLLYATKQLSWQHNGSGTALCWTTNAVPFTLQYATNCFSSSWSDWPTAPTLVNGTNWIEVPFTGPPRYFRLRMTN